MTTPITNLVMRLVKAGAGPIESASVVAEAFALGIASRDERRDASRSVTIPIRSKAALRAVRYRNKRKQNQASAKANDVAKPDSQSVTAERDASRDGVAERCDLSSFLSSSEPLQEATKEVKKKKRTEQVEGRASDRGTRIAEDFQPDEERIAFARSLGLDPAAVRDEFVDFWCAVPGSRGLKTDWQKTYRNRCREVAGRKGRAFGAIAPRPGSKDDTRERTVNALRSLDPFPYADGPGRGKGTGPPIPRQLSFVKPT